MARAVHARESCAIAPMLRRRNGVLVWALLAAKGSARNRVAGTGFGRALIGRGNAGTGLVELYLSKWNRGRSPLCPVCGRGRQTGCSQHHRPPLGVELVSVGEGTARDLPSSEARGLSWASQAAASKSKAVKAAHFPRPRPTFTPLILSPASTYIQVIPSLCTAILRQAHPYSHSTPTLLDHCLDACSVEHSLGNYPVLPLPTRGLA